MFWPALQAVAPAWASVGMQCPNSALRSHLTQKGAADNVPYCSRLPGRHVTCIALQLKSEMLPSHGSSTRWTPKTVHNALISCPTTVSAREVDWQRCMPECSTACMDLCSICCGVHDSASKAACDMRAPDESRMTHEIQCLHDATWHSFTDSKASPRCRCPCRALPAGTLLRVQHRSQSAALEIRHGSPDPCLATAWCRDWQVPDYCAGA